MASRIKVALLLLAATGGIALGLAEGPAGAQAEAATVARSATLEDLAQKLIDRFVDPDVGLKYAAMLRANAKAGKYDGIADDKAFAKAVTADLQAVAFDGHLKLLVAAPASASPGGGGGGSEGKAIEAAERLTPKIAYIRIGRFFGEPEAMESIRKFLTDNADAETLIFDVRTHIGGGLDEMDLIFPMIFDKPQVLVGMDTRTGVESPLDDGPTLRRAAAPDTIIRREHFVTPAAAIGNLSKSKVFVLSSGRTGSAAEHFVLSMKRTKRATVIGETTYGAGNFGGGVPIAGGFSAWIPVGRTFDPDTNKGWDYAGVAPNVPVPAAEALTEALVRSGVDRAEAAALAAKHGPAASAVSSLRKAPASVPGI
jgi:hypothetical protein